VIALDCRPTLGSAETRLKPQLARLTVEGSKRKAPSSCHLEAKPEAISGVPITALGKRKPDDEAISREEPQIFKLLGGLVKRNRLLSEEAPERKPETVKPPKPDKAHDLRERERTGSISSLPEEEDSPKAGETFDEEAEQKEGDETNPDETVDCIDPETDPLQSLVLGTTAEWEDSI
jgi:hypothetical protein